MYSRLHRHVCFSSPGPTLRRPKRPPKMPEQNSRHFFFFRRRSASARHVQISARGRVVHRRLPPRRLPLRPPAADPGRRPPPAARVHDAAAGAPPQGHRGAALHRDRRANVTQSRHLVRPRGGGRHRPAAPLLLPLRRHGQRGRASVQDRGRPRARLGGVCADCSGGRCFRRLPCRVAGRDAHQRQRVDGNVRGRSSARC
mmetsp:Transcript_58583/g.154820  ORF Transcript_58583/g.154820 Transcript_58583/m.154820 type:complete len:200 (+) Transcript_58583:865-1464(+)